MDKKTVILGTFPESKKIGRYYSPLTVRVDIEIGDRLNEDGKVRLSISGDTHYPGARDIESGGQIRDEVLALLTTPRSILNYPKEKIARLVEVWDRWHLNDMRPGCEHQREWDTREKIQLVTYRLKDDTLLEQHAIRRNWTKRLERGATVLATEDELRIVAMPWEIKRGDDRPAPEPDYYKEHGRETKTAGWVRPEEHPRGLLCKPCPTCGYKYGSAWKYEPLPADVVKFLEDF
jgi:hypothetical protein